MIGKSEQVTTTGAQLFDYKDFVDINTYIDNTGNYRRKYLQLKPNTSYRITIFKNKMTGSLDRNVMFIGDKETYDNTSANGVIVFFTSNEKKSATITTKESGQIVFKLNASSMSESQEEYLSQADIIISEGKDEIPYEPYTGGKPSPSPDYPQEIKNVGKWNEEKQKYEVDVKITRKNLFDKEYAKRKDVWKLPNSGYSYIPIYVGKGKRITVSTSGNPKTGLNFYCTITKTVSKTHENVYTWLYHSTVENLIKTKVTFSVTESDYIYFSLSDGVNNIEKFLSAFPDFQIEYGEERTDYEPYKEQTLTLTSDRPITKWDKLVEQDGQIGWLYQSAIDEYSGETNVSPYKTGFGFYFLLENKNIESGEGYCEELQQCTSEKVPCIHFNLAKNTYVYTLNTETIYGSTVSDIKNYLKTHPLHIVYKTETTEFIPLPKEEQDAIRALKTYYPTTVITTNGGAVNPNVEVTYIADTKNYIDQKIAAIGKTVVETQKALL